VSNEKPEEFNAALRDFLGTLGSGSSPSGRGQVRG
jgi:hypothetical protein